MSCIMTKTNKMACAHSEDSDQPGHPPSLIRVFAVRMKKAWVLGYPTECTVKTDQTGRVFAGSSHFFGFVMRWLISNLKKSKVCGSDLCMLTAKAVSGLCEWAGSPEWTGSPDPVWKEYPFYIRPTLNIVSYFLQCSASCGQGYKQRYVRCMDGNGNIHDPSACDQSSKPSDSEACIQRACGYWRSGDFEKVCEFYHASWWSKSNQKMKKSIS